jgi:hypothetical protein
MWITSLGVLLHLTPLMLKKHSLFIYTMQTMTMQTMQTMQV